MGLSGVEVASQLAFQSAGSQLCSLMGLDNLAAFTKEALCCTDNMSGFDLINAEDCQLQVLVQVGKFVQLDAELSLSDLFKKLFNHRVTFSVLHIFFVGKAPTINRSVTLPVCHKLQFSIMTISINHTH
jgi:molybdopterin/thiamine biosynthesis adenylyltransferase